VTEPIRNELSYTVDWLSYTVAWDMVKHLPLETIDEQFESVQRLTDVRGRWTRAVALHGYESAWVCKECGFPRVSISRPNHPMGIHVEIPGQALLQKTSMEWIERCLDYRGSVTRIDLAIDVRGFGAPRDLYDAHQVGKTKTRAQKMRLILEPPGSTVYAGARTSERFLRVYDKAAEQGIEGHWTRIELELKGRAAKTATKELSAKGWQVIPPLIRAFVDCEAVGWYHEAVTSAVTELAPPQPKKMTDTKAWLLGTVASTLARETMEDANFLVEFLVKVQELRRERGSNP